MVTKYVATDPSVGNDNNSGDDAGHPWLNFQKSIDRLVALRTNPNETNILYILNFQVNEPAVLNGPRYSKFQFIGVMIANVDNDPHHDALFCEPRVRLTSWDPTKPIFTVEQADDILFKDLQLFDSVGGGGIVARKAKQVHVLTCCIHDNKSKRGAGFLFEGCTEPLVTRCRVVHNQATDAHGGGAFDTCKDARIVGSVFFTNDAARSGGALSFDNCTGDISIEQNTFGDMQIHGNTAWRGGAVSAERCAKIMFGSPRGFNTYKWNEALHEGGAVWLNLCKEAAVVRDVYFENRTVKQGGALCARGTDLTLAEVKMELNHAARGGGIFASGKDPNFNVIGGKLIMESSELRRNDAVYAGGGVAADWIDVAIARCAFLDTNKAGSFGGGLAFEDSLLDHGKKLDIQGGTFQENRSKIGGGGCDITGGQVSIHGTAFEDNRAYSGGGLRYIGNSKSTFTADTCHFIDNESDTAGGAVELRVADRGRFQKNTISGNKAGFAAGLFLVGCDVRSLNVSGNDFSANKTTDIFVGTDKSKPPMTAAELEHNNAVAKAVPVVKIW